MEKDWNERMNAIEDRMRKLEEQREHRNGEVPTPPIPWNQGQSYGPAQCGKCGLKLSGVMSYCCPNGDCPCGLGPVMCGVSGAIGTNAEPLTKVFPTGGPLIGG